MTAEQWAARDAADAARDRADAALEMFKRLTAILIATVTIFAAIAAFLQTDAGGRAVQANRDAQRYAIEALGARASGQAEVDYGWYGATHAWYELNTLASTADRGDDPLAAERYRMVRDRMRTLSPLMDERYFDPEAGMPDKSRYESDTFLVRATELSERYASAAALNNQWNDKGNTYIVHLTLLAVALALFGLATTIDDWTRWIFVGVGLSLVGVTMAWMAVTIVQPIRATSNVAISSYAQGYGLAWSGQNEEAIKAFDVAIAEAPDYANAYYERGNAHFSLAAGTVGGDPQAAEQELRLAAADFEAARKAGRDDSSVNWNLGWAYYLLGFFEESATASSRALALDDGLFAVRCNLGLTLLADGKIEDAQREYAAAMRGVADSVTAAREAGRQPPTSLWNLLDACAIDVDSLMQRLDEQPRFWTQAPPKSQIADTPELRAEAQRLIAEFKSVLLALEYTGKMPGERPNPNVSAFRFVQHRVDETNTYVYDSDGFPIYDPVSENTFPNGVSKVGIEFDYQGITTGQQEVWKIYRNGLEDPSLRVVAEWGLTASGTGVKPISYDYSNVFVLPSGEYIAELYIDSYLVQRGTFTIAAP